MTQHPITPPPELRAQWRHDAPRYRASGVGQEDWLVERAAQWGADQELEACCEWLDENLPGYDACEGSLRASRRPTPPSLKEQALEALAHILNNSSTQLGADIIHRALEQLND